MEFSIDIHTTLDGEITIEDFAKEYDQYLPEEVETVITYDKYKYSESSTINSVIKVGIKDMLLLDILVNEHKEDLDSCTFNVTEDGYYAIDHIVLPNMKWWNNITENIKAYYETIYVTDAEKVYKIVDNQPVECTMKEILERNIEGTTIKKCRIDVFFTGNLQQCYINNCKEIFNILLNQCAPKDKYDQNTYARDFVWMTLNIIDYLVGFKQFMEAERIMENFCHCGGFCNLYQHPGHKHIGCGCA